MRICRVGTYPREATPGAGLVPYYLSLYIQEPTLYLTRWLPGSRRELPDHVKVVEIKYPTVPTANTFKRILASDGQPVSWQSKSKILLRLVSKTREVTFLLKSIPALVSFRPDIVCTHMLKNAVHGLFAKYILGAKFVLFSHNVSETMMLHRFAILRWIVNQADLVYVVSSQIAAGLEGIVSPEKVRVTSTGVDLSMFRVQNGSRKKRLLTVGTMKWKKGYRYLLEALPRIFAEHPDYTLAIVGDGEERERIVAQIEMLDLHDKVELLGRVPQREVVNLLNESRLFVLASLVEGLPKAMLEALACGTPVVVTDACNGTEIIQGAGIEVPARDSHALADAVNQLLSDDELWQRYAANARARVLAYDWKSIACNHYQEYQRLMGIGDNSEEG